MLHKCFSVFVFHLNDNLTVCVDVGVWVWVHVLKRHRDWYTLLSMWQGRSHTQSAIFQKKTCHITLISVLCLAAPLWPPQWLNEDRTVLEGMKSREDRKRRGEQRTDLTFFIPVLHTHNFSIKSLFSRLCEASATVSMSRWLFIVSEKKQEQLETDDGICLLLWKPQAHLEFQGQWNVVVGEWHSQLHQMYDVTNKH